jgi:hypothetical protein
VEPACQKRGVFFFLLYTADTTPATPTSLLPIRMASDANHLPDHRSDPLPRLLASSRGDSRPNQVTTPPQHPGHGHRRDDEFTLVELYKASWRITVQTLILYTIRISLAVSLYPSNTTASSSELLQQDDGRDRPKLQEVVEEERCIF